jgi:SAM-dependent methyltransferase
MKFEKFEPVIDFSYSKGWDKFALDYEQLPFKNPVYTLTKKMIYKIIEKNITLDATSKVLDIGCGTGNDFPFFLDKGVQIIGIDMSAGMLNMAARNYSDPIKSGKVRLLQGRLEDFDEDSISEKFDLIFSVSGGLSYIDNQQLLRVFNMLKNLLNPGGKIISAHFNKFCFMETFFYLLRWDFKLAGQRMKDRIKVKIKEKEMTMFLRSPKELQNIFSGKFNFLKFYPLLAATPPYQTGFRTSGPIIKIHYFIEKIILNFSLVSGIADQNVMVVSND